MLPREVPALSTSTIHFVPFPRFVFPPLGPLFRGDEAAIRKALIPAQLFLVVELGEEGPPEREQHAALFPGLWPYGQRIAQAECHSTV
jgi:hypothetical protein